ncbi:MAG: GTP-binding protein [Planctomycetales bacterium]|nr:GTP-binding protein [Planctomycetales bacterium]
MKSATQIDDHYQQALAAVEQTLDKYRRCTPAEKEKLRSELAGLRDMHDKLRSGRVEIVVFGEISTGKSALINALVGEAVASVDVQGGWTKEVWHVNWQGTGYRLPGLGDSQVVLVDTPGINEVGGAARGQMAREAAERSDLILFCTDSDLNDTEYANLVELAAFHKPIIVVLNKIDLYSREQRARLLEVLCNERLRDLVPKEQVVTSAADPREREYVIQAADGKERSEWKKPPPDTEDLKAAILEMLDKEGLALIALNAALYAADKSDRIASLRVQLRERRAMQVVWGYASTKAVAVGLNPFAFADIFGGIAIDAAMILTLAAVYGLDMKWAQARKLAVGIATAAGWMTVGVVASTLAVSALKAFTVGKSTLITALPQGAAAGYGSYIVGEAARYYFEHGASWGNESPKAVVQRILSQTDKQSVVDRLKGELLKKLQVNPYASGERGASAP